jgi:hypothetical protein
VMPLSIVNDRRAEGTETSGVRLSSPVNGLLPTPTRKVSLKDNDEPSAGLSRRVQNHIPAGPAVSMLEAWP